MTSQIDELDAKLIACLAAEPRIGLTEAARRIGVARGTAQARLAKLEERGVIRGHGPEVDPAAMGYPVLAFVFLQISQGRLKDATAQLARSPEVLEAMATSGNADIVCRVVARDTEHFQQVVNRLLATDAIRRTTSHIVLSREIPYRTGPLVAAAGEAAAAG